MSLGLTKPKTCTVRQVVLHSQDVIHSLFRMHFSFYSLTTRYTRDSLLHETLVTEKRVQRQEEQQLERTSREKKTSRKNCWRKRRITSWHDKGIRIDVETDFFSQNRNISISFFSSQEDLIIVIVFLGVPVVLFMDDVLTTEEDRQNVLTFRVFRSQKRERKKEGNEP